MSRSGDGPAGPGRSKRPQNASVPPLVGVAAALGTLFLVVPVLALAWRAPWSNLVDELASRDVREALRLSLVSSVAATAVSAVLGVPLAWVLARGDFVGRRLLGAAATLPLILPPVVGGVVLLLALGRQGLVGQWLDRGFGVRLPFTTAGVVVAETFMAMPFMVLAAEAGFRGADRRLEDAARTLGARPWTVFRRVTLPLVWPSLAAGALLCWARALGEFGATIAFAGNFPGRTQTMPLKVYLLLETRPEAALALSLLLLVASLAVLVGLRERWLRPR